MDKLVVYGIKNCDTVKKALTWLDSHKVDYDFHDYKTKGITDAKLKAWAKQVGWESLVNKKGMTWRQLDDAVKANVTSASTAIELMKQKTSVIKRPLLELNDTVVALGFDLKEFDKIKLS
jgi:Spx/MgsR family transcriptional regulator